MDEVGCLFADEPCAEDCGIEGGGCWRKAAKKLDRKGRWGDIVVVGWTQVWDLGDVSPRWQKSRRAGRVAAVLQDSE